MLKNADEPDKHAEKTDRSLAGSKSEQTRQRILDAAAFVLSRKGYSGARLSDIANFAGMKAGSLYYHFSSREELVSEVMAKGVKQIHLTVVQKIEALPADTTAIERLRVAMETHLVCLVETSDYARANSKLGGQVPKMIQVQHTANEQLYGNVWRKLLRDAVDAGELRKDINLSAVRMLMLGAMGWAIEWYKPENGPAEDLARDFAEMTLNGIAR